MLPPLGQSDISHCSLYLKFLKRSEVIAHSDSRMSPSQREQLEALQKQLGRNMMVGMIGVGTKEYLVLDAIKKLIEILLSE